MENGELLDAAEAAGFELLVTTDKNLRYRQNFAGRNIAIVLLGQGRWSLIKRCVARIRFSASRWVTITAGRQYEREARTVSTRDMSKLIRIGVLVGMILPELLLAQYYPRPRRGVIPGTPNPGAYKNVAGSFRGKLKDLSSKEITIETDDDQVVSIHRTRKTKFLKGTQTIKPSDIDLETVVTVDASEDVDLSLTAVSVTVDPPKKNAEDKN